jgi:integrase
MFAKPGRQVRAAAPQSEGPGPTVRKRYGDVELKIYTTANRGRPLYTLVYEEGGRRRRENFRDLARAQRRMDQVGFAKRAGCHAALSLTGVDRDAYTSALRSLEGTGVSLPVATEDYAKAIRALQGRAALGDAVRFFLNQFEGGFEPAMVHEVVAAMVATKTAAHRSGVHVRDLRLRLGRFARDFQVQVHTIRAADLNRWLDGLGKAPRTRNNFRRLLGGFFRFAMAHGHMPKGADNPAALTERAREESKAPGIFTPDEMRTLLECPVDDVCRYLVLGGFGGFRTGEIQRLAWSDIDLDRGHIRLPAGKAKTNSGRLLELEGLPNLRAWLKKLQSPSGPVVRLARPEKTASEFAAKRGVPWRHNGLRHSFCSYRLAATQHIHQVAEEAGNSPQMIRRHYRELVTRAEARAWFGITPPAAAGRTSVQ